MKSPRGSQPVPPEFGVPLPRPPAVGTDRSLLRDHILLNYTLFIATNKLLHQIAA